MCNRRKLCNYNLIIRLHYFTKVSKCYVDVTLNDHFLYWKHALLYLSSVCRCLPVPCVTLLTETENYLCLICIYLFILPGFQSWLRLSSRPPSVTKLGYGLENTLFSSSLTYDELTSYSQFKLLKRGHGVCFWYINFQFLLDEKQTLM